MSKAPDDVRPGRDDFAPGLPESAVGRRLSAAAAGQSRFVFGRSFVRMRVFVVRQGLTKEVGDQMDGQSSRNPDGVRRGVVLLPVLWVEQFPGQSRQEEPVAYQRPAAVVPWAAGSHFWG